jgi:hypothetical protein
MRDEVRRLLGPGLQEIAGARVSGEIPLSEALVNRLVDDALRKASDGPVEAAEVQLRGGGQLAVRLRLRRPSFAPPIIIMLRIEQQPRLPDAPALGLRWELAGMRLLARFAGPLLQFFKAGGPGIKVEGDRIVIELDKLLREHGAGELLDYLTGLSVGTRDKMLTIAFELGVRPPGPVQTDAGPV